VIRDFAIGIWIFRGDSPRHENGKQVAESCGAIGLGTVDRILRNPRFDLSRRSNSYLPGATVGRVRTSGVKSDLHCVWLVIAKHSPERILEGELPIEALEKNHGKDDDAAQEALFSGPTCSPNFAKSLPFSHM